MKHYYSIGLLALLLSACASNRPPQGVEQIQGFQLMKPLYIPAYSRSVYLQNGEALLLEGIDRRSPYCQVRTASNAEQPRTLQPTYWQVEHLKRWHAVAALEWPILARVNFGLGLRLVIPLEGAEEPIEVYHTRFELSDPKNQSLSLECRHRQREATARYLELHEIRQQLGNWFHVDVSEENL